MKQIHDNVEVSVLVKPNAKSTQVLNSEQLVQTEVASTTWALCAQNLNLSTRCDQGLGVLEIEIQVEAPPREVEANEIQVEAPPREDEANETIFWKKGLAKITLEICGMKKNTASLVADPTQSKSSE